MKNTLFNRLMRQITRKPDKKSFLRFVTSGTLIRNTRFNGDSDISNIQNLIEAMRNLANDSQISTALSYYATDSTVPNTKGDIIWATSDADPKIAEIINTWFKRLNVNSYVRDHILEIATVGNLYMPTTDLYRELGDSVRQTGIVLDNNTIPDDKFDIVPSYKIPPENIIHVWDKGQPTGYIYQTDTKKNYSDYFLLPESAVIHFSLGGLLGDYTIDCKARDGSDITYDIQFAAPLLKQAIQPTTTLNLLEDALLLSSFARTIKFICVECANAEETEADNFLQQVKDRIEQQMSANTANGDAQSFLDPQAPNNLIYMSMNNGQVPLNVVDLNMAQATEADNTLLDHYQDKKLSVLGIPKEAMNYSSNEGLGGAGSVMSQRSALYANILTRLTTAYKNGWKKAINTYFEQRNLNGFVDKFELHMSPIITTQSTIQFDKRDSTLNQAIQFIQLCKDTGVTDEKTINSGLTEILTEAFPGIGADASAWDVNTQTEEGGVPNGM